MKMARMLFASCRSTGKRHSAALAERLRWSKRRSNTCSAIRFFSISIEPPGDHPAARARYNIHDQRLAAVTLRAHDLHRFARHVEAGEIAGRLGDGGFIGRRQTAIGIGRWRDRAKSCALSRLFYRHARRISTAGPGIRTAAGRIAGASTRSRVAPH